METFFFVYICKKDMKYKDNLKGKTEKLNGKCEAKEKVKWEGKEVFPKFYKY